MSAYLYQKKRLKSAIITDDSLDNFLQVRYLLGGMVGFRFASTHPTLTHATLAAIKLRADTQVCPYKTPRIM